MKRISLLGARRGILQWGRGNTPVSMLVQPVRGIGLFFDLVVCHATPAISPRTGTATRKRPVRRSEWSVCVDRTLAMDELWLTPNAAPATGAALRRVWSDHTSSYRPLSDQVQRFSTYPVPWTPTPLPLYQRTYEKREKSRHCSNESRKK